MARPQEAAARGTRAHLASRKAKRFPAVKPGFLMRRFTYSRGKIMGEILPAYKQNQVARIRLINR
jgi:hypothetical protein